MMRKFYREVHPDLFHRYPQAKVLAVPNRKEARLTEYLGVSGDGGDGEELERKSKENTMTLA